MRRIFPARAAPGDLRPHARAWPGCVQVGMGDRPVDENTSRDRIGPCRRKRAWKAASSWLARNRSISSRSECDARLSAAIALRRRCRNPPSVAGAIVRPHPGLYLVVDGAARRCSPFSPAPPKSWRNPLSPRLLSCVRRRRPVIELYPKGFIPPHVARLCKKGAQQPDGPSTQRAEEGGWSYGASQRLLSRDLPVRAAPRPALPMPGGLPGPR